MVSDKKRACRPLFFAWTGGTWYNPGEIEELDL
jgi:hypothetical protein